MLRLSTVAAALAISLAVGGARAEGAKITLRLADSLPTGHVIHEVVTKPLIEAVGRRTDGRVEIKHFPAEQLGKAADLLMLTQSGVVDIGYVVPAYASDKMPLTAVGELPGVYTDSCRGTAAFWALTRPGQILAARDFAANGVRPLVTFMLPIYQIVLSTKRPVERLADLDGLKIRSSGGAFDLMLRALKAVPIRMAPPEIYQSLSRGTLDGALLPYLSAVDYDVIGLLKSGTTGEPLSSVLLTYSISEAKWRALPQDVQAILAEEGERITRESCERFTKAEKDSIGKATAKGVRLVHFSDEDERTLATTFDKVKQDWAAGLDRRNKPGSEVLRAWESAIVAAPAP
jgi:TRAP-type C4-dicarboxylate transport system substrate-binding protein